MAEKLEVVFDIKSQGMDTFRNINESIDQLHGKLGSSGLAGVASAMKTVTVGAFAAVGAAVATAGAAYAAIIKPAFDMADALQKQADVTGLSTTSLQEYSYAAKQSGASSESFTNAAAKLTENIYKAYKGNSELSETFKKLGVSVKEPNGAMRDVNETLDEAFNKLADIKNPAEQSALAVQLLGKGGREIIPMLRGGSEGLAQMRGEAGKLGQVLSEDAIKNLDAAGDKVDMLGNQLKVSLAEGVNDAMPAIQLFVNGLSNIISHASDAAQALGWLAGGEKKWKEELAKQEAANKEIQDMISLKKEYESIIGAQKAFKAKNSELFDEETLVTYEDALKNLKIELKELNTPPTKSEPTIAGPSAEELKKNHNAMIKLQKAYNTDQEKIDADNKTAFEKSQKDKLDTLSAYEDLQISMIEDKYKREEAALDKWLATQKVKYADNASALANVEKTYALQKEKLSKTEKAEELANSKKLDSQLDKLKVDSYKDENSRRKAALKLAEKDAEKSYKEMVKDAKGNTTEIAKAEQIKTLTIKAANDEYDEYLKNSEARKKELARETARDTLTTVTDMLQSAAAKHKEAAIAYKAMAYTQTVIDTYKGAQSSYNALAGITVVGPVLGALAAGVAIAAGLVRANEIRKQQFASGGTSSGGLAIVGEMGRELVNLSPGSQVINHHQTQQLINNSNRGTTINLTIQGSNGRVSSQLTREFRNGSGDYLMKVISKQIARRG